LHPGRSDAEYPQGLAGMGVFWYEAPFEPQDARRRSVDGLRLWDKPFK